MVNNAQEENYGIIPNPLNQQLGSTNTGGEDMDMIDDLNISGQFSPPHENPDDMMTGGND